jgi:peptidoglycan-N-acetylglucosamine deacetylase
MIRVLGAAALAFLLAAGGAQAGGSKLAYFQPKTIFHSGLMHTHTVALTFDDGPNANTPAVLDALRALGVKGTFFIVGRMAKTHPEVLARIAEEGHLLANHSATHVMLSEHYDEHPELLLDQIREVDDEITPLMPAGTKFYFRAPYGTWHTEHADILNADPTLKKYIGPIYWDEGGEIAMSDDGYVLSAADWECWHRGWDADTCAKGYLREIRRKNGGVVLMHCIHMQSAELVATVVAPLVDEGYSFVRLDQIEDYHQYETPPEETGPVVASAAFSKAIPK